MEARAWLPALLASLVASSANAGFMSDSQYVVEVLEPARLGMRRVVLRCDASGAAFGMDVGDFSFTSAAIGCPVLTEPENACGNVTMPKMNETTCLTNFALVPRGNCSFSEKAYYVQQAKPQGYEALIVYNDPNQPPIDMGKAKYADDVRIPVVMVTYACMKSITERFPFSQGYVIQLKTSPGYYDLLRFLVPFIVVVGLCLIILLISLLTRVCRERRRLAKSRLSKKKLKMLPTRKYRKGEQPDTCAICLEEFQEGEKLRILPCRHTYHTKCVDPWLTKNRKVCPLCKRKVGSKEGEGDSSESDTERRARVAAATAARPGPSYIVAHEVEGPSRERDPLILNPATIGGSRYQTLEEDQSIGSMVVSMSPDVHIRPGTLVVQNPIFPAIPSNERTVQATVHNVYDSNEHLIASDMEEEEEEDDEHPIVERPTDLERGVSQSLPNTGIVSKIRTLLRGLSSHPSMPSQIDVAGDGEYNNGFQESPVQRSPASSSNSVNVSSSDLPPRERHPAATGRLTDAELTLSDESDEEHPATTSHADGVPIVFSPETHPYGRARSVPCMAASPDAPEHVFSPEPDLSALDDLDHPRV